MNLTNDEYKHIKGYIFADLNEDYGIDEATAKEMMKQVEFDNIRSVAPELLCHYGSEYWAKWIFSKCSSIYSGSC